MIIVNIGLEIPGSAAFFFNFLKIFSKLKPYTYTKMNNKISGFDAVTLVLVKFFLLYKNSGYIF